MIETLKLEKSYGFKQALKGITLTIEPGQVVVLAGPNGAGKSTFLRILAGLARRTVGASQSADRNPGRRNASAGTNRLCWASASFV